VAKLGEDIELNFVGLQSQSEFAGPLLIGHCGPNRQYIVWWGLPLFWPVKNGAIAHFVIRALMLEGCFQILKTD